ncbi:Ist1 domain-containing protein [Cephalotus follicularis]|uniref:Ist1 domain-containing protein n=1 Tax=Cephalotus follicularis TaxID=3775 RepID=A0A1Q3CPF2_CEPFO|nr:Ist1 domain-containing protein [Cephalotus follicularis]
MLDGLLGRGFGSKCKSLIKLIKSRIDVIRRKRNATQKFLKKDIADLLSNGLDINAYGRVDGLIAELCVLACYDFVEHCCDFVLKHLHVMQKQRQCPDNCKEAVSSLMFAAARFSDLPELRDLRHMFYERYGNSVELFVNQRLVENLASETSTTEKKVQLMQDIAAEFSIKWDSKGFEQRMFNPSASALGQHKIYGKETVENGEKHDVLNKERLKHANDGHRLHNGKDNNMWTRNGLVLQSKQELFSDGDNPLNKRDKTILKQDNHEISLHGRREVAVEMHEPWMGKEESALKTVRSGSSSRKKRSEYIEGGSKLQNSRERTVRTRDSQDSLPPQKPKMDQGYGGPLYKNDGIELHASNNYGGQHNVVNLTSNLIEEEKHKLKPFSNSALPPPYVKPNVKPKERTNAGSSQACFDNNGVPKDPSKCDLPNAGNKSEKTEAGLDHPDHESHYQDGDDGNILPKARSMRRRRSKSRSSHDDVGDEDTGVVTRKSRSRRRDDSKRGLQILFDDEHHQNDEEERIIDKLLMHYSKKPAGYEPGKVRRKSRSHHAHHQGTNVSEAPENGIRDGPDEISDMVPPPVRSISLPHEQTARQEVQKVFARAASFQPDRSDPARHVHPKLPDYDELAARFANLKGR